MPPSDSIPEIFRVDMNNLQAKFGFRQLERIDKTNKRRMENARILTRALKDIPGLELPPFTPDREHVAVHYAIWTEDNKGLQRFLILNKIDAQNETAIDTTQLGRFKKYVNDEFPNARKLHEKLIFLPTHPNLKEKDLLYMAGKVKEFFRV